MGAYDKKRAAAAKKSREEAADGCDVGDIPAVKSKKRRESCRLSLRRFATTYFAEKFYFGFSPDHDRLLDKLERAVLKGELCALALPRGSGKTTLCEIAAIWSLLYGHRRFVVIVGADKEHAEGMLLTIKTAFETNAILGRDFPEVCTPIRALEGAPARCKKQTCKGVRTRMQYADDCVVLPTIAGRCTGPLIKCRGILGRIRGMKHSLTSGEDIRPDLVIVDDPQTEESSQSPPAIRKRIKVLTGGILGLAGPGKKIAGMMPCTVLEPGDMADQILDRDVYPQWQGDRIAFVKSWPERRDLWDKYVEILREDLKFERGGERATEFYRKHRKAMDAGFEVYWADRKDEGELSARQHFWNKYVELGPEKLASEYQNDPACPELISTSTEFEWHVSANFICTQCSGIEWQRVHDDAAKITAMIDVHGDVLYYGVAAWSKSFTGWIVDYGSWPNQKTSYFAKSSAKHTLSTAYPEIAPAGTSALLHAGLEELTEQILGRRYLREDGTEQHVDRCLIDANWGPESDTVYDFCHRSRFRSLLLPSHGNPIGINKQRIDATPQRPGEIVGHNWRQPSMRRTKRKVRYINFDPHAWLVFAFKRLAAARGAVGSLELPGKEPTAHRMLADQMRSQRPQAAEGVYGRRVIFADPPPGQDNHLLDVVVGLCVGASVEGCELPGVAMESRGGRRKKGGKKRLSKLQ